MDRGYNFSLGSADNGNVMSITNYRDSSRTQTFTYDNLNRITSGWSTADTGTLSWGENYAVDPWGNLMTSPMLNKVHGGNFQCAGDPQNHATCLSYDAAGNVIVNSPASYVYDQENRIASTAGMTYVYDANGNRVEKTGGGSGTLYWYGAPGILAESDLAGNLKSEYVFFGGKRVARIDSPGNSVHYYLSDHLNSTSMIVSSTGIPEEESDYSPFGTEYPVISSGLNHYKFTGKERDAESGLDYFGARYDSSAMGRFTSPDSFYKDSHAADPQSWNEYAYTRNNPLRYVDPTGENATVSTSCSTANNKTTCNVNISASISIYAQQGSNISQQQLNQAATDMKNSIEGAWKGSFTQDGVTYNVSTQVTVSVATSEQAAMSSGAQNVIGMTNGPITLPNGKQSWCICECKEFYRYAHWRSRYRANGHQLRG